MGSGTSETHLAPGQEIGGCVIDSFIARGGMGDVYKARKSSLGCDVAVKVLQPALVAQESIRSRFVREAKVAASLAHPSIVKVYDVGEENGLHYIVMEFVEGRDLRDIVKTDGRLPVQKALRIARQVADALEYAHVRGIVHRDVKPANILLSSDGVAKLVDMGLARPAQNDTEVTLPGEILGTPVFMSPEQYRGEAIDGRSDLYSLGATLYMLLSGRPPFQSETTAALVHKVLNQRPPPLRTVVRSLPDNVVALVQRLMAKHPSARYQTGREVVSTINEILMGRFVFAREAKKEAPTEAAVESADVLRWCTLCILGVLLGLGVYLAWPSLGMVGKTTEAKSPEPGGRPAGAGSAVILRPDSRGSERDGPRSTPAIVEPGERLRQRLPDGGRISDPALQRRIESFKDCLARGDCERVLAHVHPSQRKDDGLQFSLARFLQHLSAQDLQPGIHVAHREGPESAQVVLLFRGSSGERSLGLPMEWVRVDGEWYVKPIRYGQ